VQLHRHPFPRALSLRCSSPPPAASACACACTSYAGARLRFRTVSASRESGDMPALTPRRLRIFNIIAAVIQLACGIALGPITDRAASAPWYTDFINAPEKNVSFLDFIPVSKMVASVPLGYYSCVFLLLSGVNHALCAMPGINGWYNKQIALNSNPIRWLEYAFSASVMHVMILQLSGATQVHLLYAVFGLTMTTMTHGWLMERSNMRALPTYVLEGPSDVPQPEESDTLGSGGGKTSTGRPPVDWTPFLLGFIPHIYVWTIIACYFFRAIANRSPPAFVYVIFFIELFIDLSFAVNMMLQYVQVPGWRGYGATEFWYIVLSLTAKQLLAWINYGGTKALAP